MAIAGGIKEEKSIFSMLVVDVGAIVDTASATFSVMLPSCVSAE
jgi:hypothetical protein